MNSYLLNKVVTVSIEINKMILLKPAVTIQHRWPVNMTVEDIIDFEEQSSYQTCDSYLKFIGAAWVSPDSVVYKNGRLIVETLASKDLKRYYSLRHLAKKILTGKKIYLGSSKKYLLVTDSWSSGHFHWFCDVLPKLFCIKARAAEFVLLLPDIPYIKNFATETLQKLQINFEDIVFMNEQNFYHSKNLFYVSRISQSGHMNGEIMKDIQKSFLEGKGSGTRKIYVSRQKGAIRKIVNGDQLDTVLKEYGFEILFAEGLTLDEEIDIFSTTDTLLGLHGAGLTNCVFMHPGSKVIELRRKENGPTNVGFWHLADSLQHDFYYYNGTPDSSLPLVGRGCNIDIPVKDFEKNILQLINK